MLGDSLARDSAHEIGPESIELPHDVTDPSD
jgi:hypothetical protein